MKGNGRSAPAIKVTIEPRTSGRSAVLIDGEELAVGQGAVVCAAARKLIERGHDPGERLEAWRGDTLCLTGPLGAFAKLTVEDGPDGRPRFRLHRSNPWAVSPLIAANEAPATQGRVPT